MAEALLAFAGLRDLLDEVFDEVVDSLPVPQARALEVALLRRDAADGITERTAVAAGLLTALRHLARGQPVVVALDDAQWLDAPSAAALTFVLRRCAHEPLALVATRRAGVIGHLDLSAAFGGRGVRELAHRPDGPSTRADVALRLHGTMTSAVPRRPRRPRTPRPRPTGPDDPRHGARARPCAAVPAATQDDEALDAAPFDEAVAETVEAAAIGARRRAPPRSALSWRWQPTA